MRRAALALIALLATTNPVLAREPAAAACIVPPILPRPQASLPDEDQPVRRTPVTGYTLALTWSPQYCRRATDRDPLQCAREQRFGMVLHGLWPDSSARADNWPQFCRPTPLLSASVIRANFCRTLSVDLIQHEWAKHGTCMSRSPQAYFAAAARLYDAIRWPDMDALSRRDDLTAGDITAALLAANPRLPGLAAHAVRVRTTRDGWLDEIWLCLDRRQRYAACPATKARGAPSNARVKIWRGGSSAS